MIQQSPHLSQLVISRLICLSLPPLCQFFFLLHSQPLRRNNSYTFCVFLFLFVCLFRFSPFSPEYNISAAAIAIFSLFFMILGTLCVIFSFGKGRDYLLRPAGMFFAFAGQMWQTAGITEAVGSCFILQPGVIIISNTVQSLLFRGEKFFMQLVYSSQPGYWIFCSLEPRLHQEGHPVWSNYQIFHATLLAVATPCRRKQLIENNNDSNNNAGYFHVCVACCI